MQRIVGFLRIPAVTALSLYFCNTGIAYSEGISAESELEQCSELPYATNELLSSSKLKMNDGFSIPILGLGTSTYARYQSFIRQMDNNYEMSSEELVTDAKYVMDCSKAVIAAVRAGYRHFDTAVAYNTEQCIGDALTNEIYSDPQLNVQREDIFLTSKIPMLFIHEPAIVQQHIENTLQRLQTEYIDLYLLHSPHTKYSTIPDPDQYCIESKNGEKLGSDVLEIYALLLENQKQGKIRSVGVSNFNIKHLESLEKNGLALPAVNQIEIHCFLYETALIEYCLQKGIVIEAYCPIARADELAVNHPLLNELAEKYDRDWSQIMIRWLVQKGFVVIPKSFNPLRIVSNGNVFDFVISDDDMKRLDQLKRYSLRKSWNPLDIEWEV